MLPKNWGAPAIFEKQTEIRLLHPVSNLEARIQVLVLSISSYDLLMIRMS
ncbi:MAG: hypothetical protein P8X74_11705 [Reinekea sp.]